MTEKRISTKAKVLGLSIASGVLLILLAVYTGQPEKAVQASTENEPQNSIPARFGPGVWAEAPPPPDVMPVAAPADTNAPGGLATTAEKKLVINKALKDVADYFLLGGHPGTRPMHLESLLAHLRASLPSPAREEAVQVAQNYQRYLDAHDAMLARDAMPSSTPDSVLAAPEIERIAAWHAQRTRLRQELLGIQVAQVWFGEEEAMDQQVLAGMRQGHGVVVPERLPTQETPSDGLQALREQNASYAEQRTYVLNQFGEQAAQRFDAIEGKEQAWKTRYASYRQAVENIRRQPGVDRGEQSRLIDTLRAQTFATEQERLRAENLDALPPQM